MDSSPIEDKGTENWHAMDAPASCCLVHFFLHSLCGSTVCKDVYHTWLLKLALKTRTEGSSLPPQLTAKASQAVTSKVNK